MLQRLTGKLDKLEQLWQREAEGLASACEDMNGWGIMEKFGEPASKLPVGGIAAMHALAAGFRAASMRRFRCRRRFGVVQLRESGDFGMRGVGRTCSGCSGTPEGASGSKLVHHHDSSNEPSKPRSLI